MPLDSSEQQNTVYVCSIKNQQSNQCGDETDGYGSNKSYNLMQIKKES